MESPLRPEVLEPIRACEKLAGHDIVLTVRENEAVRLMHSSCSIASTLLLAHLLDLADNRLPLGAFLVPFSLPD